MGNRCVHTEKAPAAIGPYSQGTAAGDFVFVAGQLGIDPATGKFASEDDVQIQTKRALENVKAVLEAAGTGLGDVVKTTVFLSDISHFKLMNEMYAKFFCETCPARSTIAAKQLPLGALVEIDAVAIKS